MRFLGLALLAGGSLLGQGRDFSGPALDELTIEQRTVMDSGGVVFITQKAEGSPWPAVSVYQFIGATPAEAAAVFFDYERHSSFMPSVKQARIAQVLDPRTVEIEFIFSVPIFPDEHSTMRETLSLYGDSTSYRIDWLLLKGGSMKATVGYVRFEPYRSERLGRDGTLMAYYNLVTPSAGFAGAGVARKMAMSRMREAATALAKQVESERAANRALLESQVGILRTALER